MTPQHLPQSGLERRSNCRTRHLHHGRLRHGGLHLFNVWNEKGATLTAMQALSQNLPNCSPSDNSNTNGADRRQAGRALPQRGQPHRPSASLLSITMSCKCEGLNMTEHSRRSASVTTSPFPSPTRSDDWSAKICRMGPRNWREEYQAPSFGTRCDRWSGSASGSNDSISRGLSTLWKISYDLFKLRSTNEQ